MLLANLTKREYVDLRKVNDYLFQTIFFALLWGGDFDHPQFGRWAGDQVVVITDPEGALVEQSPPLQLSPKEVQRHHQRGS